MYRKGIVWLYLFLLAAIADMAFLTQGETQLRYISKPLIVTGLLLYFLTSTRSIKGSILRKSVAAGLLFSIAGDTLLLFPNLFLYGLGAFLMTHVCFIIAFKLTQNQGFNPMAVNFVRTFFFNLPIYISAAFVYFLIRKNLQDLQVPVVIYIMVIVMMVTMARERFGRTNAASFWQVFLGAILFLISDSILALNRFFQPIEDAGVLIMGTYMMAQLLIVMGIRSHLVAVKK
ncbi:MAG: lysoplasmalogenase [Lunatimonas sp.]|uniref:lysoplasmalogenase n=1 Tax=Lunatimonas sp. TaxID=2060141 RepID=UPI00263B9F90|nr:lysoplasmalogenase [Lunatimonas sp.]MCC5937822.1 lysoplasmalogenase [Lunatimonas sp.]